MSAKTVLQRLPQARTVLLHFFTEDSCRGKGDPECHIIGQSMELMSDETRRAIEEFQGADFELEMRTVLASLDERTKELEVARAH
jgi:hypothetical protein